VYAILKIGGKQYKVAAKDVIEVNKLKAEKDEKLTLDKVLLVGGGKKIEVGKPYVDGASVEAEVIGHTKAKKVLIYKYLRRKDAHKKTGHRQELTKLLIKKINK